MRRRITISLVMVLGITVLAVLPSLAQAETKELVSGASNSLCIEPTARPEFYPGAEPPEPYNQPEPKPGYNYLPLKTEHLPSGTPFPDTGSACTEPSVNHAVVETAEGHYYMSGKIPGYKPEPKWVGANSAGSDAEGGRKAPSYYIYDETFTLSCTAGAEIEGTMWANNAAGAFLNGHPIGYQNDKQNDSYRGNAGDFVEGYESPKNGWPFGEEWGSAARGEGWTSYGPNPYKVPSSDFLAGTNTIQFVVEDGGPAESSSAAGVDWAATIKSHSCVPWLSNGKVIPEGQKAQTYSWGTLTFSSPGIEELVHGTITCKKSDAGDVWNEGGNGHDDTVLFDLYECHAPECPGVSVTSSDLPWYSELVENAAGVVKDKSTGVHLTFKCGERELEYEGEVAPKVVNASKGKATYEEFGEGSSKMEGSKEAGKLQITGKDYQAGFEEGDEVITTGKTKSTKEEPPVEEPAKKTNVLALGDSISFGYTQEKFNLRYPTDEPSGFENGFVNFFAGDLEKKSKGSGVTIVNDACPGETSNGLIGENPAIGGELSTEEAGHNPQGPGDWHPCAYSNLDGFPLHAYYGSESQLENALSILGEGHPTSEVKAITLNIGSNDELAAVAQCEKEVTEEYSKEGKSKYGSTPEGAVEACIVDTAEHVTFPRIVKNVGDVLGVLDSTEPGGGHYSGPIILLGFYNPDALVLPGSDVLQEDLNGIIEKEVVAHFPNVTFANPFPVFNKGKNAEQEQASICKYTEMCNPNVQKEGGKPAGKDGDIHPSLVGYEELAKLVNSAYLANPAH